MGSRVQAPVFLKHESILPADAACFLQKCQDVGCSACISLNRVPSQRYHCPVCPSSTFKPSTKPKVLSHLESHFKTAIKFEDVYLVRCRREECNHKVGHYHCPLCNTTRAKPYHIRLHLTKGHAAMPKSEVPTDTEEAFQSGEELGLMQNVLADESISDRSLHVKQEILEAETLSRSDANTGNGYQSGEDIESGAVRVAPVGDIIMSDKLKSALETGTGTPAVSLDIDTKDNWDRSCEEESALDPQMQVSVLPANAASFVQQCLDPKCTACAGRQAHLRFHCPVCPVTVFKPSSKPKLISHLDSHFKTAVKFKDVYLVRCSRILCGHCIGHYHCPLCPVTRAKHTNIKRHLIKQHGATRHAFRENMFEEVIRRDSRLALGNSLQGLMSGRQMALRDHGYQILDTAEKLESEDNSTRDSRMSVLPASASSFIQRCQSCAVCAGRPPHLRYHCPVCPTWAFKPTTRPKVIRHVESHFRTALKFEDIYLVRCRRRRCRNKAGHYHCPLCSTTRAKPKHIRRHLATQHGSEALPQSAGHTELQEETENDENAMPDPFLRTLDYKEILGFEDGTFGGVAEAVPGAGSPGAQSTRRQRKSIQCSRAVLPGDFKSHPSVRVKGTENNYDPIACLDTSCQYSSTPHMHCPFCVKTEYYQDPVILKAHYRVKHVDKGIEFAGLKILRCCDQCDIVGTIKGTKEIKGAHWHCYRCKNGFNRRDEAFKHYRTHFRNPQTTFQIQVAQEVNQMLSLSEETNRATDILAQHEMTNIQVHSIGDSGDGVIELISTQSDLQPSLLSTGVSNGKAVDAGEMQVPVAANETVGTSTATESQTIMIIEEEQPEEVGSAEAESGGEDHRVEVATDGALVAASGQAHTIRVLEEKVRHLSNRTRQLEIEKVDLEQRLTAEIQQLKLQVKKQSERLAAHQRREQELVAQLAIPLDDKTTELLNSLKEQHEELLCHQLAQLKRSYLDSLTTVATSYGSGAASSMETSLSAHFDGEVVTLSVPPRSAANPTVPVLVTTSTGMSLVHSQDGSVTSGKVVVTNDQSMVASSNADLGGSELVLEPVNVVNPVVDSVAGDDALDPETTMHVQLVKTETDVEFDSATDSLSPNNALQFRLVEAVPHKCGETTEQQEEPPGKRHKLDTS